jgi:cell shape-determining protein MreC
MAARENQGYLIAVIVLVLLSLVLALAAFLGLSKMNEYADNKAAAEQNLAFTKELAKAQSIQSEILKAYIGDLGPSVAEVQTQIDSLNRIATSNSFDSGQKGQIQEIIDSVMSVKDLYDKDMLGNVGTAEAGQTPDFTWRSLVKNLSTVLATKHNDYFVQVEQARLAQQKADTEIASKQTQVDQMQSMVDTLKQDLEKEKQQAAENLRKLTESLEQGKRELQDVNARFDEFKLASSGEIDNLQNKVAQVEEQNTMLKDKINTYEREVFDSPDGQVVKVASSLGTVYLDLGREDGLTENRSFAIYDQSVTNFEKDRHKATVEVINVMDHQAEARVTSEDPTNPILTGDYVLTATWDPGYAVPIALAGKFDLDQDGYSDLDKLIQMISRNGGKVVAYHDDDGNVKGQMDSSVRYLVLGEAPSVGPDANPNVVRAMEQLEAQAEANTIQVIDLQKLLNRMGVRGKPKLEKIDRRIEEAFPTREPSDSLKATDR